MSTLATLELSNDSKVTNLPTPNGKSSAIKNAFGLTAGPMGSCPSATDVCRAICYGTKAENRYGGATGDLVARNYDKLRNASYDDMVSMLATMVAGFVKTSNRRGANLIFRIHWDGDFFNGTYTAAWSKVVAQFPEVQFWVYTRVAASAMFLHAQRHQNLSLYFSADRDNIGVARTMAERGVNVAYLGESFDEGKQAFPSATRCPQNNGALPIIDAKGSACAKCRLCVDGRKSVLFKIH